MRQGSLYFNGNVLAGDRMMLLNKLVRIMTEMFEWIGDMNMGERSHLLIPIEREQRVERETRHL